MKIYGIKNCDSVKKSLNLLDSKGIKYEFIDYKKNPPSEEKISNWIDEKGIDIVINKRGMMWKKLSEEKRKDLDKEKAVKIATETPTIIKRPVIEKDNDIIIGFDETKEIFA